MRQNSVNLAAAMAMAGLYGDVFQSFNGFHQSFRRFSASICGIVDG